MTATKLKQYKHPRRSTTNNGMGNGSWVEENRKEAGKYQGNIETLKSGDETIAKQLAKLYTKCIKEPRIHKTLKVANVVIFFMKGNRQNIKKYRPICLPSTMYTLFTNIIITRLEKKPDETQPRERAGFRSKYSTTDHMHAIYNINNLKRSAVNTTYHCVLLSWITRMHLTQFEPKQYRHPCKNKEYKMGTSRYWKKCRPIRTALWQYIAQREWENQDQEKSKTGGHHLTQAVHGNIGEHI